MEEWVGSIWHKYVTKKASTDYADATVTFEEVKKSLGVIFRAMGGHPAKRIEAVAPRDYLIRRSLLQKISGSYQQTSLAWQDNDSLRLPEQLSVFPTPALNKDLYVWLSALAAHQQTPFTHWVQDNQRIVKSILAQYKGLQSCYYRLVDAFLRIRTPLKHLLKEEQALERALQQALQEPGSVLEFPATNYAPSHIVLWLYPSAGLNTEMLPRDTQDPDTEDTPESNNSEQQQSQGPRKKTNRVENPNERDGMMIFRLESLFSWSEFSNIDRGKDDSDNEDAQRVAEDLDVITLANQSNQKSAKLKIDLDLPAAAQDDIPLGEGIKLPEWDYKTEQLVSNRVLLQPMLPRDAESQKIPPHLHKLAQKIRAQFEQLQTLRQWHKGQQQGEELDINAWLDHHVETSISATPEKGLFQTFKSHDRDLACLLLADISMSTDAHLDDHCRVIDVVKDSMLLFAEALSAVNDRFAMYGFSSVKRKQLRFTMLKNFNERYNDQVKGRVQSLKPGFYTRMGGAIRQATKILSDQAQSQKLLLILTDGKPNDIDHYEGRFGIEDTKQAVLEAKKQGLRPFCITIDQKADEYLPYLFGSNGFTVILRPTQLPQRLPSLYYQLTR